MVCHCRKGMFSDCLGDLVIESLPVWLRVHCGDRPPCITPAGPNEGKEWQIDSVEFGIADLQFH